MKASFNGHLEVVRTLLEGGGDVNAESEVRNQMIIMMMIIIILLTIMMMMMTTIVINDEDVDNDDRRSMYLCL